MSTGGRRGLKWLERVISGAGKAGKFNPIQKILEIKSKTGNFNIGKLTRTEIDELGRAWVGPGARSFSSKGKIIGFVSKDRLKTFRLPALKSLGRAAGQTQANLTEFIKVNGKLIIQRNAHIDLIP